MFMIDDILQHLSSSFYICTLCAAHGNNFLDISCQNSAWTNEDILRYWGIIWKLFSCDIIKLSIAMHLTTREILLAEKFVHWFQMFLFSIISSTRIRERKLVKSRTYRQYRAQKKLFMVKEKEINIENAADITLSRRKYSFNILVFWYKDLALRNNIK
jgi:hypothetical protein